MGGNAISGLVGETKCANVGPDNPARRASDPHGDNLAVFNAVAGITAALSVLSDAIDKSDELFSELAEESLDLVHLSALSRYTSEKKEILWDRIRRLKAEIGMV